MKINRMIRFPALGRFAICVSMAFIAYTHSATAADGDKAGWQLRVEGEGEAERQFLIYAQRDNGSRVLTFACERDIDTFGFYAEDLGDLVGPIAKATLTISSGPAKFSIPGVIEPNPDTEAVGFVAEVPQNLLDQRQQMVQALAPLLLSNQPIHMAFGAKSRDLPAVSGMLDPAKRFLRSCFGS
jgi:hypothetical protein